MVLIDSMIRIALNVCCLARETMQSLEEDAMVLQRSLKAILQVSE